MFILITSVLIINFQPREMSQMIQYRQCTCAKGAYSYASVLLSYGNSGQPWVTHLRCL